MSERDRDAAKQRAISEASEPGELLSRLSDAERVALIRALARVLAEREEQDERVRRLRAL